MILLIGGHRRSGTTLLISLLNSHSEIAITHEFYYFYGLGKTYTEHSHQLLKRLWDKTIRNRKMRLKGHLRNYSFVARYLFNMQRYHDGLVDVAAIRSTLHSIFPEVRIVGDNTPDYVFLLDKFVVAGGLSCWIIFRDCRDVTSSTLERFHEKWHKYAWMQNVNTAEKVARRWVHCIEIMERQKDKIHMIRYEDLVREPRNELERLGKWLEVDHNGFSERIISTIRNTSIGKYKSGLTDDELKTVMEIAGPTMARLGYI
jgi:hypothetical protein